MDKFYQISTELWPLIEVQNSILLNLIRGGVSCLPAALSFICRLDKTSQTFSLSVRIMSLS